MPLQEVHVEPATSSPHARISSAGGANGLVVCLLVVVGAVLRFAHLTSKPFWFDETFSVELARLRWDSFLRVVWWREANMSLYYVLLRAWLHFGQSEFFIRSLSVLFALVTIPAIYGLAKRLYDRRVAFIAAALFTCNAYNVYYAQEARSYTLFVLLATLSSGFLVAWLRGPARDNRIAYVLGSILAVYAHFYALLLVASHWIVVRAFGRTDRQNATASILDLRRAWRTIGLAVLPLLFFVVKTGAGPIRWIHRPGLHDLLGFCRDLSGGSNWWLPLALLVACLGAVAPLGKRLIKRGQDWESWRVQFLLVWLIFPIALTLALSFLRPVFLPRFLILCQPALIILAAAGIARLRKLWLIGPVLCLILLLALQGVRFIYAHDYDDQRDGSAAAVNFILDHTQPGDAIIFHIAEARLPYEFFRSLRAGQNTASSKFASQLGPDILFPHFGPSLDYSDFKAKPIPEILRSALPNYSRVWVMFMYNQGGGAGRTTAMLTHTLSESLPRSECRDFPRVEVCLYSKQ